MMIKKGYKLKQREKSNLQFNKIYSEKIKSLIKK